MDFPAVTFCEDSNNIDFNEHLVVLDCTYHKIPCNFFEIFEKVEILYWGVPTTFLRFNTRLLNSTKPVAKADRSGWEYSLYMVLYFPKHLDFYIGHNTYEPTFYNIAGVINPGILTDLVLSKTVQKTLGLPYNTCVKSGETFDSDLFRETISSGYQYRQVNCYDLCLKKHYIKECNLVDNDHNGQCYTNVTANFDFKRLCENYCPLECDSVTIQTNIQTLNFESITWPVIPERHANTSYNLSNVFSLWIYFENIQYTEIEQIPKMYITDLVSSIGGCLGNAIHFRKFQKIILTLIYYFVSGLFLGLSFISLVEIGQLLCRLCFHCVNRNKKINIIA